MRTPHTLRLIRDSEVSTYDPITDTYSTPEASEESIPCLATYLSKQRVFEEYGDRVNRVLTARFMQPIAPFDRAEFDGRTFVPIERTSGMIKGAVRLKEVAR